MKTIKVRLIGIEPLLGSIPQDQDIYRQFIASKAPDASTVEEEVASLGADAVAEKGMTVFIRDDEGKPALWDYHIKGLFKDSCGALRKIGTTKSAKLKSYKKVIDKLIFVYPRKIPITSGTVQECQRPLRTSGPSGERVALAASEEVPAPWSMELEIECMDNDLVPAVKEWLTYGRRSGLGQWRNSGKGRFRWELLEEREEELDL